MENERSKRQSREKTRWCRLPRERGGGGATADCVIAHLFVCRSQETLCGLWLGRTYLYSRSPLGGRLMGRRERQSDVHQNHEQQGILLAYGSQLMFHV